MSFKQPSTFKDILLHFLVIIGSAIFLIAFVFYIYLPISTNHGETITVPDVRGMTPDELEEFLTKRDLRWEVTSDSSYSSGFPPLAVLQQMPKPNTKVKENRKIYVTLNAERPPLVRMPKVEDLSLQSAQMVLMSYDLNLGELKYVPDPFFIVLEARMDDRAVLEGERIEKGSKIDLVVGDGYGNTIFQAPAVIGQPLDEAEIVIIGSGLKVGKITPTLSSTALIFVEDEDGNSVQETISVAPGTIQEQSPKPGRVLKIGDIIDLWVYKPDSINENATILDN